MTNDKQIANEGMTVKKARELISDCGSDTDCADPDHQRAKGFMEAYERFKPLMEALEQIAYVIGISEIGIRMGISPHPDIARKVLEKFKKDMEL